VFDVPLRNHSSSLGGRALLQNHLISADICISSCVTTPRFRGNTDGAITCATISGLLLQSKGIERLPQPVRRTACDALVRIARLGDSFQVLSTVPLAIRRSEILRVESLRFGLGFVRAEPVQSWMHHSRVTKRWDGVWLF